MDGPSVYTRASRGNAVAPGRGSDFQRCLPQGQRRSTHHSGWCPRPGRRPGALIGLEENGDTMPPSSVLLIRLKRVVVDEVQDDGCQFFTSIFLDEMACIPDRGMGLALRTGNTVLPNHILALGDRV